MADVTPSRGPFRAAAQVSETPRTPEAARDLAFVTRLAWWLDDAVRIPVIGVRVGLDPLLGLIPGLGDASAAVVALLIVGSALRHRVPKTIVLRMALNVAFDFLVGLVPVAGDVADVFVKSNEWNLALLRRHAGTGLPPSPADRLFVTVVLAGLALLFVGTLLATVLVLRSASHALAGFWSGSR